MRTLCSPILVIAMSAATVGAQPHATVGAQPQPTYAPPPGYGQPAQPGYGPGYGYRPPMQQGQLTLDERWLLRRGFISDGEHIAGGAVALVFGLGLGQAIQGRWSEMGWVFTLGESAAVLVMMYGVISIFGCEFSDLGSEQDRDCADPGSAIAVAGLIGYGVFRVWGAIDAFAAPPAHNRRVRDLRSRLGLPVPMYSGLTPYVAPLRHGDGGTAGVTLRF
jgi:hypothetical protein